MSKFIDQITLILLRGYKAERNSPKIWAKPSVSIEAEYTEFNMLTQYRVGVEFMNSFYAKDRMEAEHLKENFIEEVKEFVYGDLRSKFRNLEVAIYDQDRQQCQKLMDEIFNEIS